MKRPTRDPFYAPLDAPPPPGRVLRLRRVTVPRVGPAEAVQVVYSSVGTTDEPIAVSGTVLIPTTPWPRQTPRPVLSYGVGVHGLGRDAAPSYLLATGAEPEAALIGAALQQGWTVAVTDGEGLGMPGPHSYGAGRIGGRAMLDIARVAAGLSDVRPAPPPVALWGYSEGGRCAAWAAEQGPSYAPDLDLVGLAAGGVPTDLYAVARAIDGGPYSGLGFAVLVGLAHAHGDPRLWDILNRRGRAAARIAADLDVGGLVVAHPHPMATYTVRSDPWDEPVWRALLAAERNPVAPPRGARAPLPRGARRDGAGSAGPRARRGLPGHGRRRGLGRGRRSGPPRRCGGRRPWGSGLPRRGPRRARGGPLRPHPSGGPSLRLQTPPPGRGSMARCGCRCSGCSR